jgi:hypothetical protein
MRALRSLVPVFLVAVVLALASWGLSPDVADAQQPPAVTATVHVPDRNGADAARSVERELAALERPAHIAARPAVTESLIRDVSTARTTDHVSSGYAVDEPPSTLRLERTWRDPDR